MVVIVYSYFLKITQGWGGGRASPPDFIQTENLQSNGASNQFIAMIITGELH
jgi:hypothetical protein